MNKVQQYQSTTVLHLRTPTPTSLQNNLEILIRYVRASPDKMHAALSSSSSTSTVLTDNTDQYRGIGKFFAQVQLRVPSSKVGSSTKHYIKVNELGVQAVVGIWLC